MELSDVFGALAWLSVLTFFLLIIWAAKEAFTTNSTPEPKYIFIRVPCSVSSVNKESVAKSKIEPATSSNTVPISSKPEPISDKKPEPPKDETKDKIGITDPFYPLFFTSPPFFF